MWTGHKIRNFFFHLPVVHCFVSRETRLLIFVLNSTPVNSKDWTTAEIEQFKSLGIKAIRPAQWKLQITALKKITTPCKLKDYQKFTSVPKLRGYTCTRALATHKSLFNSLQCYNASYFLCFSRQKPTVEQPLSDHIKCKGWSLMCSLTRA